MTLPTAYVVFDIETTGLNACYDDRITCICAKDSSEQVFKESGEHEKILISNFLTWLLARKYDTIVSANGRDFDVPFVFTRAVLLGISPTDVAFLMEMTHFDLQAITRRKISLNDLATLLLGQTKTGNGFEAIRMFEHKQFDSLKRYCMDDVLLTEQVYQMYARLRRSDAEVAQ